MLSTAIAAPDYSDGDLLLGFRADGNPGGNKTYVVNIGPASQFTTASSSFAVPNLGNIAGDLVTTFTDPGVVEWNARPDVFWGIVGTDLAGDPANTLYVTRPRADVDTQTDPWTRRSNSAQSSTNSTFRAFISGFTLSASNASSPKGTIQSTSAANNYAQFTSGGSDFGYFDGIEGDFTNGTVGSVLDLYRLAPTTQNPAGAGLVFVGTFKLSNSGVLTFTPPVQAVTIATSSSPAAGGTTSGGGTVDSGTSVTVVATPNAGYNFVNWTEGGSAVSATASYTFTAGANRTLVANFAQITYTIATSASPAAGGTTSGGGTVASGSSVTVVATPNAGYNFVNWTEGVSAVSGTASYTFTAGANRTLVANFAQITYTIATSASPAAGGTTSGGGTVASGSSVTVVATANAGYNFVNWTEAGSEVSASASYTFTASANRTLVANFALGANANLSSLVPSAGTLAPAFASGTTSYTTSVPNATSSITVTPTTADSNATVTVDGVSVASGTASDAVNLSVGPNVITTVVTAADGATTKTYTVTVTRAGGPAYANGDLLLGFRAAGDPGSTKDYVVNIGSASQFTQAATAFAVPGLGNIAADLSTSGGALGLFGAGWNTRADVFWGIVGTDLAGDPANTLYATRPRETVDKRSEAWARRSSSSQSTTNSAYRAFISGFTGGGLNAVSPKGTIQSISDANSYAQFTSGGSDFGYYDEIEGDFGNGTVGSVLDLYRLAPTTGNPAGAGLVFVGTFKLDDGGVLTFTPAALALGSNADLVSLEPSAGTLNPAFVSGTTSYTAIVPNATTSITLTPTVADSNATVKVNGVTVASGAASGSIALAEGSNVITTVVTAEDGTTTKTYTLTVTRESAYTIATSASPAAGGTTSGGGTVAGGASVTVVATPNAGYNFVNWTEGGSAVSATASYTFTASANRTLVANFVQITYTIATSASPVVGGTTSGGGTVANGASVTVVATPNAGYNFVNWTEGGSAVSATASYTFTAGANRTLVANFAQITYMIATSASPAAGGTTSGGGTVASGASVTVVATPNAGYNFVNWTESGSPVSATASYTFTASANRTLVANFSQVTVTYTIATSASPAAGGTTSGGGSKAAGSSVTVVATPNAGYSFVNWTEGGSAVSASASYTFTANANRTLVANFTAAAASDFAGNYSGLATPTAVATNPARQVGLAWVSVASTGAFTGKLQLGGSISQVPFTGTFGRGGPARFGVARTPALEIKRTGLPSIFLALSLDVQAPVTHRISGSLTENGIEVSSLEINRHLYTPIKNPFPPLVNVPLSLRNQATDAGKYTAVFQALTPEDQGRDATAFPQGDGYALLDVLPTGAVMAVGRLGDGQSFAVVSYLSKDNVLPLYLTPYGGTGTLSGPVSFRDLESSDADGAGLRWFKPANAADTAYRSGWPAGVKVDLVGSKYVSPTLTPLATRPTLLGNAPVPPATAPNAQLTLSDGWLASTLANQLSVDVLNQVTVLDPVTGAPGLSVKLFGQGLLFGSFTHSPSGQTTTFAGVVLQKSQTGSGYFFGAPPAGSPAGTTPQSGAVTIGAE